MEKAKEWKPIDYKTCAFALLMMWNECILTDSQYREIMHKLDEAHEKGIF